MELTLPMLCERDLPVLRRDPRLSVRAVVDFRIIVADKAGIASGQVINMTTRGCGLRLTKPLKPGQYLTLIVYPDGGPTAVPCDVGRVQWVEGDRAGLAFLSLSLENEPQLQRLCGDRLTIAVEDLMLSERSPYVSVEEVEAGIPPDSAIGIDMTSVLLET